MFCLSLSFPLFVVMVFDLASCALIPICFSLCLVLVYYVEMLYLLLFHGLQCVFCYGLL